MKRRLKNVTQWLAVSAIAAIVFTLMFWHAALTPEPKPVQHLPGHGLSSK